MVGTKNMFNCLGIVIHNAQGSCGVITHVEAQDSEDEYISHIEQAIQKMMIKLNASGGNQGSLEVVTLGNAGGGQGKFGEKLLFVIESTPGSRRPPRGSNARIFSTSGIDRPGARSGPGARPAWIRTTSARLRSLERNRLGR